MLQEILDNNQITAIEPENNREISAKNEPESPLRNEKSQENPEDNPGEKNPPKKPQNAAAFPAELSYEDYLREKAEAEAFLKAPDPELTPEPAPDQSLDPQSPAPSPEPPAPEPPVPNPYVSKPLSFYSPWLKKPDRWQEDFGNPRKIKGCYG
jgi:hypothetical protein